MRWSKGGFIIRALHVNPPLRVDQADCDSHIGVEKKKQHLLIYSFR